MADCVFCQIAARESPASFVYEDDAVIAFMDIQPVNPGHMLVAPRKHFELMGELDELTLARTWQVVSRLANALRRSGARCEGVNLLVADGEAAFQDVPHFHVHIIPRFAGDGFGLTFPAGYENMPPRSQLDAWAAAIRGVVAPA
ncbi:MAG TPA: HIT family protein [Candidatus Dormibacteraeota bacterium]